MQLLFLSNLFVVVITLALLCSVGLASTIAA